MPPTENIFPTPLELLSRLIHVAEEEAELDVNVSDEEMEPDNDSNDSLSEMEIDLECNEVSETESEDNNFEETPLTSLSSHNIVEDRRSLCRRLVFASRRLFSPDGDEENDSEIVFLTDDESD